jgi:hypothetical protein
MIHNSLFIRYGLWPERFVFVVLCSVMIDPNAPQVIQQVHPSWFDWITVAAIVLGPILALFAQRVLDWIREKKKQRVQVYLTAMAFRSLWLHIDSIRALNSIDTVFDKRRDKPVRDAWAAVIAQAYVPRPLDPDQAGQQAWDQRLLDLRMDLYQRLGTAVGYDHTLDYVKNHGYTPKHYGDVENELAAIRKGLGKVITNDGLKIVVNEPPAK